MSQEHKPMTKNYGLWIVNYELNIVPLHPVSYSTQPPNKLTTIQYENRNCWRQRCRRAGIPSRT